MQAQQQPRPHHWNRILAYEAMILAQETRRLKDLALSVEARTVRMLKRINLDVEMASAAEESNERFDKKRKRKSV